MTWQIKIAIGLVSCLCLIASGWFARSWYEDSVTLKIEQVKDAVAVVNAEAIAGIQHNTQIVTAKTVERIRTEVIYKECVADQGMMDLTNKARGY